MVIRVAAIIQKEVKITVGKTRKGNKFHRRLGPNRTKGQSSLRVSKKLKSVIIMEKPGAIVFYSQNKIYSPPNKVQWRRRLPSKQTKLIQILTHNRRGFFNSEVIWQVIGIAMWGRLSAKRDQKFPDCHICVHHMEGLPAKLLQTPALTLWTRKLLQAEPHHQMSTVHFRQPNERKHGMFNGPNRRKNSYLNSGLKNTIYRRI